MAKETVDNKVTAELVEEVKPEVEAPKEIDTVENKIEPEKDQTLSAYDFKKAYEAGAGIAPDEKVKRIPNTPGFLQTAAAVITKIITNAEKYQAGAHPFSNKASLPYMTEHRKEMATESKGDAESLARDYANWQSVDTGGYGAMLQSLSDDARGDRKYLAAFANAFTKTATHQSFPQVEAAIAEDPVAQAVFTVSDIGLGMTRDLMITGGVGSLFNITKPLASMVAFETVQGLGTGVDQYISLTNLKNSTGKETNALTYGLITAGASITAGIMTGAAVSKIASSIVKKAAAKRGVGVAASTASRRLGHAAAGGAEGGATAVVEGLMRKGSLEAAGVDGGDWVNGWSILAGLGFGSGARFMLNYHLKDQNFDLEGKIIDANIKNSDDMFDKNDVNEVDFGGFKVEGGKAERDAWKLTARDAVDLLAESGAFSRNPNKIFLELNDKLLYREWGDKGARSQARAHFKKYSSETAGKVVAVNSETVADYYRGKALANNPTATSLEVNAEVKAKMDTPLESFANYVLDGAPKERADFDIHVQEKLSGSGVESADFSAEKMLLDSLYNSKGDTSKFAKAYTESLEGVARFQLYHTLVETNTALEKGMGSITTTTAHQKVNELRGLKANPKVDSAIKRLRKKIQVLKDQTSNVNLNDRASVAEATRANEAIGALEAEISIVKSDAIGDSRYTPVHTLSKSEASRLGGIEISKAHKYGSVLQKAKDRITVQKELDRNILSRKIRNVNKAIDEQSMNASEDTYNLWEVTDNPIVKSHSILVKKEIDAKDRILPLTRAQQVEDEIAITTAFYEKKINEDAIRLYSAECQNAVIKGVYDTNTAKKVFEQLKISHNMNLNDYKFANKMSNYLDSKYKVEQAAVDTTPDARYSVLEGKKSFASASEDMMGNHYLPVEFTLKAKGELSDIKGVPISAESKTNVSKARSADSISLDLSKRLSFLEELNSGLNKGSRRVVVKPLVNAVNDTVDTVFGMKYNAQSRTSESYTLNELKNMDYSHKADDEGNVHHGYTERATFLLKENVSLLDTKPKISDPTLRFFDDMAGQVGSWNAKLMMHFAKPTAWVNAHQASIQSITNLYSTPKDYVLHLPADALKAHAMTAKTLALGKTGVVESLRAKGDKFNNENMTIKADILERSTGDVSRYHSRIDKSEGMAVSMKVQYDQMKESSAWSEKSRHAAKIATVSMDVATDKAAKVMNVTDFASRSGSIDIALRNFDNTMKKNKWVPDTVSKAQYKYDKMTQKDLKFEQLHPVTQSVLYSKFDEALATGDFKAFKTAYAEAWTERLIFSYAASAAPRYQNKLRSHSKTMGLAGVFTNWGVKNRNNWFAIGRALENGNPKPFIAAMAYSGVATAGYLAAKQFLDKDNTFLRWGWNYGVMRTHVANMIYPLAAISRVFDPFTVQDRAIDGVVSSVVHGGRLLTDYFNPNYDAPEVKRRFWLDAPDANEFKDLRRGGEGMLRSLEENGLSETFRRILNDQLLDPARKQKEEFIKDIAGE